MSDSEFEIVMQPVKGLQVVRFNVEVVYESEQVERYRLSGGAKWMLLEKKIETQHSWRNWRVLDVNFVLKMVDEFTVMTLHHIYKLIDEKRFGRRLSKYYRKSAVQ